jgi:hypothetical protein
MPNPTNCGIAIGKVNGIWLADCNPAPPIIQRGKTQQESFELLSISFDSS